MADDSCEDFARREGAILEIQMNQTRASKSQKETNQVHVEGENEFLIQLAEIWNSYHRHGLEATFKMGKLLNEKLGPPRARQLHGRGTINRVREELRLSKRDISALRRIAAMADSIDEILEKYPQVRF